ncbi:MAG TPA: CHC2 zinc finger domain-containing protein [Albitalea sp.]|nr:CHC2 zinc finger domain-containing protein [Albitalea sp.]
MIPKTFIDDLKARAEVFDVVSRYVELKKTGINYQGLCPFHSEKKPSFTVSPGRRTFHCFGCGAHGDALKFIQEHLGLSFVDSVKELAAQVGVPVPDATPEQGRPARETGERHPPTRTSAPALSMAQALERADAHYRAGLRKSPAAIEFLKARGISGETARAFRVGYAAGSRNLASAFPEYDATVLLDAGLVRQTEDGARHDRFVDAVTFPVRNSAGVVGGFLACPIGPDAGGEWVASRFSPAFRPDRVPFGLFEARQTIQSSGYVVVSDGGCLDVLALFQAGIRNAVSPGIGTLNAEQLSTLLRFTHRVMFLCTSDSDGTYPSAVTYTRLAADTDGEFRIAFLPAQASPSTCLRSNQLATLRDAMAKAKPVARQPSGAAA